MALVSKVVAPYANEDYEYDHASEAACLEVERDSHSNGVHGYAYTPVASLEGDDDDDDDGTYDYAPAA